MSTDISEINLLKEQANILGISHSPNIGVDTLKERISKHVDKKDTVKVEKTEEHSKRHEVYLKAMKLVRVIVTPTQPKMMKLAGDEFIVSGKYLGDIYCYVPFNIEWHIPYCIYNLIVNKKAILSVLVKGKEFPTLREVPLYTVNILEPLTTKELNELKKNIAARGNA